MKYYKAVISIMFMLILGTVVAYAYEDANPFEENVKPVNSSPVTIHGFSTSQYTAVFGSPELMTSSSTSICSLTKVIVEDTDSSNEAAGCTITISSNRWRLAVALADPNNDAKAWCEATCFDWGP